MEFTLQRAVPVTWHRNRLMNRSKWLVSLNARLGMMSVPVGSTSTRTMVSATSVPLISVQNVCVSPETDERVIRSDDTLTKRDEDESTLTSFFAALCRLSAMEYPRFHYHDCTELYPHNQIPALPYAMKNKCTDSICDVRQRQRPSTAITVKALPRHGGMIQ